MYRYIKVILRNFPVNPSVSHYFTGIPSISRRPGKYEYFCQPCAIPMTIMRLEFIIQQKVYVPSKKIIVEVDRALLSLNKGSGMVKGSKMT